MAADETRHVVIEFDLDDKGALSKLVAIDAAQKQVAGGAVSMGQSVDAVGAALGRAAAAASTNFSAQVQLTAALAAARNEQESFASSLRSVADMYASAGRAGKDQLQPTLVSLSEGLVTANAKVNELQQSLAQLVPKSAQQQVRDLSESLISLGRGARDIGLGLSAALTVPLVGFATESIKAAAGFETAMTRVTTLAGASKAEVAGLTDQVLALAPALGVAPEELAKGLFVIESAGLRGAAAMDVLTTAAKMTAIGMGSVEENTRAVIGAVLAYSADNLSAAEAANILVKTVQLGNMRIDELVGALSRVIPVAAAMHVSFADVNAAIATFTHLGAPVDVAVTGLRAVLSTLEKGGKETQQGLAALGMTIADVRKEMQEKGLTETLLHLVDAAKQSAAGIDELDHVFPNIRALTLVLADAASQAQNYVTITEGIRHAGDVLNEGVTETKKTLQQQWNEITAGITVVETKFGTALAPAIKNILGLVKDDLLPALTHLADAWNSLPEPLQLVGLGFGALAAAIGPTLVLLGTFTLGSGMLLRSLEPFPAAAAVAAQGINAIGGAAKVVFGPEGAIIAGLIAATLALREWTGSWTTTLEVMVPPVGGLMKAWQDLRDEMDQQKPVVDAVKSIYTDLSGFVKDVFTAGIGAAKDKLLEFRDALMDSNASGAMTTMGTDISDLAKRLVLQLIPGLREVALLIGAIRGAAPVVAGEIHRAIGKDLPTYDIGGLNIQNVGPMGAGFAEGNEFPNGIPYETAGFSLAAETAKNLALAHVQLTQEQRNYILSTKDVVSNQKHVIEMLEQSGLTADQAANAIRQVAQEHKEAASAAKAYAKALQDAHDAEIPLTAQQAQLAEMYHNMKLSPTDIAELTGAKPAQVQTYIDQLKMQQDFDKQTADIAKKADEEVTKQRNEELKKRNQQVVDYYNAELKAQKDQQDALAKQELSSFDVRRRDLDLWYNQQIDDTKRYFDQDSPLVQQKLDEIRRIYKEKLDAINQDEADFFEKSRTFTVKAADNFSILADAIGKIGHTIGGTLGAAFTGLDQFLKLLDKYNSSVTYTLDENGDITSVVHDNLSGQKLVYGSIGIGAGIVAQATSGSTSTTGMIAHDAAVGTSIGVSVAPYLGPYGGVAIGAGAGIGALVGWIRSFAEWRRAMADVQRDYGGLNISEDLSKKIENVEDTTGLGRAQATLTQLSSLIKEAGGLRTDNFDMFFQHLRDGFSYLQRGTLTLTQMTQILNDNFAEFARVGTDAYGRINDQVRELISLNDQWGTQAQSIADFLKTQAGNAGTAFNNVAAGILNSQMDAFDTFKKNVDDLTAKLADEKAHGQDTRQTELDLMDAVKKQQEAAHNASGGLADLGEEAIATFASMVSHGYSAAEAIMAIHPALQTISKAFKDLNLNIDDPALQTLLRADTIFNSDPNLGTAVTSLPQLFAAFQNMPGTMNPSLFAALERTGKTLYDRLLAAAQANGGGQSDALSWMQPFLHMALDYSQRTGTALDDNTQAEIDLSKKLGIWQDEVKSPLDLNTAAIDRNTDMQHKLIEALGKGIIPGTTPGGPGGGGPGGGGPSAPPGSPGGGPSNGEPGPGGGGPPGGGEALTASAYNYAIASLRANPIPAAAAATGAGTATVMQVEVHFSGDVIMPPGAPTDPQVMAETIAAAIDGDPGFLRTKVERIAVKAMQDANTNISF